MLFYRSLGHLIIVLCFIDHYGLYLCRYEQLLNSMKIRLKASPRTRKMIMEDLILLLLGSFPLTGLSPPLSISSLSLLYVLSSQKNRGYDVSIPGNDSSCQRNIYYQCMIFKTLIFPILSSDWTELITFLKADITIHWSEFIKTISIFKVKANIRNLLCGYEY